MATIRRFFQLSFADQIMLATTTMLIIATHTALRLLPFKHVRQTLQRFSPSATSLIPPSPRILWAVEVTSNRLLKKRPCLTKALVAQMLLARAGCATILRIGVNRANNQTLQAHAWLEQQNHIIIGQLADLHLFVPLPPIM